MPDMFHVLSHRAYVIVILPVVVHVLHPEGVIAEGAVLLLVEPTNHLDIESIRWLEQFLARSGAAVILVSHDRAFINNVTQRTLEISCGKVIDYRVPYNEYVRLR